MTQEALRKIEWPLWLTAASLLAIGLILLFSLAANPGAADFNPVRQLVFAGLGIGLAGLVAKFDFHLWIRLAPIVYIAGLVLLVWVLVGGASALGATRWIDLGFLQFQPAEFIKLGLVLMLARLLARRYEELHKLRYFLWSLLIAAIPMVLVLVQPDLGSALVLGFIWLVMVVSAPFRKWYLLVFIVAAAVALPLVSSQLEPYQQERLTTFLDPAADPQGAGYNVNQATIAVGSGGLLGRGLTSGSQSQLNFLPSQHTDFIFAVLAEKLGFVGAALVLALFVLLLVSVLRVAWHTDDKFGFFIAVGAAGLLLVHVLVNIGMNLQLLPVTGIPLPLLSYGGTNLIVTLLSLGLLQSVVIYRQELVFKE